MPAANINLSGDMTGADLVATPEAGSGGGSPRNPSGNGAATAAGAGALGSAYAAYNTGVNNRRIARYNANIARIQAFQAQQRATWEGNRIRERTAATVSAQRAGFAGQGIVVGSGTAAAVTDSTEAIGAGDVQQAQMNGIMAAWGYEQQARDMTLRGQLDYGAGVSNAAGDLATGAGQAYEFEYGMHH